MTVSKIWNRWVQEGHTERHAESQLPTITRDNREERHLILMALMDRTATPRALSQDMVPWKEDYALTYILQNNLNTYIIT